MALFSLPSRCRKNQNYKMGVSCPRLSWAVRSGRLDIRSPPVYIRSGVSIRKWLERGLSLRFTTTSLTISYIFAANVLNIQMNFCENSERSYLEGTISTRYGTQTVVRSYDQTMLILMKTVMKMTIDSQAIAGSTTGGTPNTECRDDAVFTFR